MFVILYFTHYTRVNTIYTILKGKKELTNVLIDPEYFDLLPVTLYKNWPFVGGGMRQILMNETDFGLMSYPPIVVETASLFETEEWNERVERIFSLIPITKTSENVTLSKQHVRWVIMFSCTKFWTIILGRPLTNDETAKLILLSSEECKFVDFMKIIISEAVVISFSSCFLFFTNMRFFATQFS